MKRIVALFGLIAATLLISNSISVATSDCEVLTKAPSFVNCPTNVLTGSHCDTLTYIFEAEIPCKKKDHFHEIRYAIVSGPGDIDNKTGEWKWYPDIDSFNRNQYRDSIVVKASIGNSIHETPPEDYCTAHIVVKDNVPKLTIEGNPSNSIFIISAPGTYTYEVIEEDPDWCDAEQVFELESIEPAPSGSYSYNDNLLTLDLSSEDVNMTFVVTFSYEIDYRRTLYQRFIFDTHTDVVPEFVTCPDSQVFTNCQQMFTQVEAKLPYDTLTNRFITYELINGPGFVTRSGTWYANDTALIPGQTYEVEIAAVYGDYRTEGDQNCTFTVTVVPNEAGFVLDNYSCGDTITFTGSVDMYLGVSAYASDNCDPLDIYLGGVTPTPDGDITIIQEEYNGKYYLKFYPAESDGGKSFSVLLYAYDGFDTLNCQLNFNTDWYTETQDSLIVSIGNVGARYGTGDILPGDSVIVPVNLKGTSPIVAGFDLLIGYDAERLTFTYAMTSTDYSTCDWEYFTYRKGIAGNCDSVDCPSGLIQIVAIAETNNGSYHPSCYFPKDGENKLVDLFFRTNSSAEDWCTPIPLKFFWMDCGDNSLTDSSGSKLFISGSVLEYDSLSFSPTYRDISDFNTGYPTYTGAQNEDCNTGSKPTYRNVTFINGMIYPSCRDTVSLDTLMEVRLESDSVVFEDSEFTMDVNLTNPSNIISGFNLFLQYNSTAFMFNSAEAGDLLNDCGWEYFTYSSTDPGDSLVYGMPYSVIRIVAVADMNNGDPAPSCYLYPSVNQSLAKLNFYAKDIETFAWQTYPFRFYWASCGDNMFTNQIGFYNYVSRYVYDRDTLGGFIDIAYTIPDMPTIHGYQPDECNFITPVNRKIDYYNTTVSVIPNDSIIPPDDSAKIKIWLEADTVAERGQYVQVDINMNNDSIQLGGFDLLFMYESAAFTLEEVLPGNSIPNCDWEYFTFRYETIVDSSSLPPNYLLARIVAVADLSSNPNTPYCYLNKPGTQTLAELYFRTTDNPAYQNRLSPVRFYWADCGDNMFSDMSGQNSMVSRFVYDDNSMGGYINITDSFATMPTATGYQPDECFPIKPVSHYVDYYNVNVEIEPSDSIIVPPDSARIKVWLEPDSIAYHGQEFGVDIKINNDSVLVGGFELMLQYENAGFTFQYAEEGEALQNCDWEYFTYQYDTPTDSTQLPSSFGMIKIVALANTNNGSPMPTCYLNGSNHLTIARLHFLATNDYSYRCQTLPLRFFWNDCGDNMFTDMTGTQLLASRKVFEPDSLGIGYYEIQSLYPDLPTMHGWQSDECGYAAIYTVTPSVDYYNTLINLECKDTIDNKYQRGDVNANYIAYEIADAVLYANYFLFGSSVFTVDTDAQIRTTDINWDYNYLTVEDLAYMFRIITGDAVPGAYAPDTVPVHFYHDADNQLFFDSSQVFGVINIQTAGYVTPTINGSTMDKVLMYHYDSLVNQTNIMLYSMSSVPITNDVIMNGISDSILQINAATFNGDAVNEILHVTSDTIQTESLISVKLEADTGFFQGEEMSVYLKMANDSLMIGGFDFLILYDNAAFSFQLAEPGEALDDCDWEYFTYRHGMTDSTLPLNNVIRMVALADLNNGSPMPSCYLNGTGERTLARMQFLATSDRSYECQKVPFMFYWKDCGDNMLTDPSGTILYASRKVYDKLIVPGTGFIDITSTIPSLPTTHGWQSDECDYAAIYTVASVVDYYNTLGAFPCADYIDHRGDVNLNGIAFEIADQILFINSYLYGTGVFTIDEKEQLHATDANEDHNSWTVEDLAYMYRVIVGDTPPFTYIPDTVDVDFYLNNNTLTLDSTKDLGILYLRSAGNQTPFVTTSNPDVELAYAYDSLNNYTNILLYLFGGTNPITSELTLGGITDTILQFEASTFLGDAINEHLYKSSDSVYQLGDLNLNLVPYEIADAVLFTNYFVFSDTVFKKNPELQIANSDCDQDGAPLQINDLMCLIRVITGDAEPYGERTQPTKGTDIPYADFYQLPGGDVYFTSSDTLGIFYARVDGNVTPTLLDSTLDFSLNYNYDIVEDETRIIMFSISLDYLPENKIFINVPGEIFEVQTATIKGEVVDARISYALDADDNPDLLTPTSFGLHQNYPNPFNNSTVVSFDLPRAASVTFEIINILGQTVYSKESRLSAGTHQLEWDGTNSSGSEAASGIYYYRIRTDGFTETKKMLLLK